MYEFASLDGKIVRLADVFIPGLSAAAFYGHGVFTTIAVYNSIPFQWDMHWSRITTNAAVIGIDLNVLEKGTIKDHLAKLITHNKLADGRARLTFFSNSLKGVWNYPAEVKTSVLITTADFKNVSHDLRLTLAPYPIYSKSILTGVKSCNYLENILALEHVKKSGFDEAVRVNENQEIVSAVMANIFWVKQNELFTSPLETGALAGTTRSFLMENFPVAECKINFAELKKADEIILTSAGLGIARVDALDNRKLIEKTVFTAVKKRFTENWS